MKISATLCTLWLGKTLLCVCKPQDPQGSADLQLISPQSDTSLYCQTMYRYSANALCDVSTYIPALASTHCTYPQRDSQAELTCMAGYIPRWFTHLPMVTHPSTNRAQCQLTSLLRQTALSSKPNHTTTRTKVIW